MAWEQVVIKTNKGSVRGMMQGDQLDIPNMPIGKTVNVNGKDIQVESSILDERDNVLKIKLAMASTKKEKSDDKPTQGSD